MFSLLMSKFGDDLCHLIAQSTLFLQVKSKSANEKMVVHLEDKQIYRARAWISLLTNDFPKKKIPQVSSNED